MADEDDKPLPARRAEDGVPAPRFEFRVSLSPEEIVASFHDDERIEWVEQGPPVWFALPGTQFQVWKAGETHLVVRHAMWNPALGPSPNVHIEWTSDPRSGTIVRGLFSRRAVPVNQRPLLLISAVAALLFLFVFIATRDVEFVLYVVGSIAAFFAIRRATSDRPTPKSMKHFGPGLWRLIGEKFVPHALGPAEDDPFRE